jgi:FkbM family methyltransferase
MISTIRRSIGKNKLIKKIFNKLGGTDYAIYDRSNIICGSKFIDYFVTLDGAKYKVDGHSNFMVEETRLEYDWSDIKPDDIVLDIGANIGGFTIGAALKAKHVYAVEPIFYKELEENIKLNNLKNVTILTSALGSGESVNLSFNKIERKNIPTHSLTQIINMIELKSSNLHKISFIKCDCEGGEWFIKPNELNNIRRIEIEIHPNFYPTEKNSPNLISYIKNNWNVTITNEDRETPMLHAHPK